jgi:hypothetical protein
MNEEVKKLWPELEWINDISLREKTARTWELALGRSVLNSGDLDKIPFTLLCGPELKVSFMAHKRCVVHIARASGEKMNDFFTTDLPVLEYELDKDGKAVQGKYGQYLRHPFSGVSLAEECGLPPEVCHIIAAHAHEGDLVKRTTEAYIVHHADFMTFLPFKSRLIV